MQSEKSICLSVRAFFSSETFISSMGFENGDSEEEGDGDG